MDSVITIMREASASLVEKRSEFIGYACPVANEDEATAFIKKIKKKHADARHNVFAYVLNGGALKRYSDDGEPQGSAGMPVLDVLTKTGLDGVAVVVTRYFGGILLGTGGLVRAYSAAAKMAVEAAGIVTLEPFVTAEVTCTYNDHQKIAYELKRVGAGTVASEFSSDVKLSIEVAEGDAEPLFARLCEITASRAIVKQTGTKLSFPKE
jgi:uncharacterized YigZ family protein